MPFIALNFTFDTRPMTNSSTTRCRSILVELTNGAIDVDIAELLSCKIPLVNLLHPRGLS